MSNGEYAENVYDREDGPVGRSEIGINDLFPKSWDGRQIIYSIGIRAKLVNSD